jgi:hypothetical protein
MSSSINNWYNEQNLSVNEGEFEGYNIRFDLTFKDGGNSLQTKLKSNAEQYEGNNVWNRLERGSEDTHRNLFTTEIQPDGSINEVGGVTDRKKLIMMNSKHDNSINRIHEVGHTLGLDDNKNTGNKGGVMAYPPEKMTQKEANQLGNGSFLPKVE